MDDDDDDDGGDGGGVERRRIVSSWELQLLRFVRLCLSLSLMQWNPSSAHGGMYDVRIGCACDVQYRRDNHRQQHNFNLLRCTNS